MGQRPDEERLDLIRDAIIHHTGSRPGQIARLLRLDNKTVQRALVQLDDRGDLLAEDEQGHLFWIGRRNGGGRPSVPAFYAVKSIT